MNTFGTKGCRQIALQVEAHYATRWLVGVLLALLSALTYWLYQQGFSAGFQFDDAPSIGGVSRVSDLSTAMAYLFDGRSGSVGRPLSLATFLLQKASWPHDPAAFFMVNTLIHLFNGVLVFWLSFRLTKFPPKKLHSPLWFSLAVSALWLTLPLHASASLMAVQRMTTLSSMFMLLGLIGYVSGRAILDTLPVRAYWVMSTSVVLGMALAVLCKEIGVLLPLYVLVLEIAFIQVSAVPTDLRFKRWVWIFLGAPILLLFVYFIYRWPTLTGVYATRSFTLYERLLTEPKILWEYIDHIFLPHRSGIGPYQDNYPVSRGLFDPGLTAAAILAWVSVIFAAWWFRKHSPLILFAVLWFLAGHLIESTFIPLELYFEHRNYLASYGLLLAVTALIWNVPVKVRRAALTGLLLMVVLRVFVLHEVTSTWGQPLLSAKLWAEDHPQSLRAIAFLAKSYSDAGNEEAARQTIMSGYARNRNDSGLALHTVYSNCKHDSQPEFLVRIREIEPALFAGALAKNTPILLRKMLEAHQQGACPHLTMGDLFRITELLLENPRYQAFSGIMVDLHFFKNKLYTIEGKTDLAIREILIAFDTQKEYAIALAAARAMVNVERHGEAVAFLDRAMSFAPRNPLLKQRWKAEFEKFKLSIREALNKSAAL